MFSFNRKVKKVKPLYQQIMPLLGSIRYVDVGARAIKQNQFVQAFPNAQYIGFELDVEECERLNSLNIDRHKFYPQAIGRKNETATLYMTRNPACSSLYEPNSQEMHRFLECGPYFDVLDKKIVTTVCLDDWCRKAHIPGVEFLELDTQGSELDILQSSSHLLATSILGLQVEVEFFQLYKNQPLFSDVDAFLQRWDFILLDLSRYRLRRSFLKTRGQLLWGHAFYLKNIHKMSDRQPPEFLFLAAIASYFGFEDYALEVLTTLMNEKGSDSELNDDNGKILNILASYHDHLGRPIKKVKQDLGKKKSSWRISSRKDRGYYLKD